MRNQLFIFIQLSLKHHPGQSTFEGRHSSFKSEIIPENILCITVIILLFQPKEHTQNAQNHSLDLSIFRGSALGLPTDQLSQQYGQGAFHALLLVPLYQLMDGLGAPVTLQASLTVSPSSAVQSASSSSKSGGTETSEEAC